MKLKLTAALSAIIFIGLTAFIAPKERVDTYTADLQKSSITWMGKKLAGTHYGTVALKSATLVFNGKKLAQGGFVADMPSLKDKDSNANLEKHLKSADFFGVDKFPDANFVIQSVSGTGAAMKISGNLTIKGITVPMTFPATLTWNEDGSVTAKADKIIVDRTKFDIKFKSKSIFSDIGDNFIYDEFEIGVNIVARKGASTTK